MPKSIIMVFLILFIFTLMVLVSRKQHILPTLLCLEGLMLFLIMFTTLSLNNQLMEAMSLMIVMLVMSVSSASIGLTLLTTMSRKEGNDSSMFYSTSSC